MDKVIVIVGPTAIGKSELAISLAKEIGGEIINADASSFRKGLDIGTAKVDTTSCSIKHHMIDIIDVLEEYSIKEFQNDARNLISMINKQGKYPILVGGSGLYVNATIYDYKLDAPARDSSFEEKYQQYSNEQLFQLLQTINYEASLKLHPNNRKRVLRMLDKINNQQVEESHQGKLMYDTLVIYLNTDRELLYERINERVDEMIHNDWIEECIALRDKGFDLLKIKEIGYQEIGSFLDGKYSKDEAIALIKQRTRHYAKRQITWFNHQIKAKEIIVSYQNIEKTKEEINSLVKQFI